MGLEGGARGGGAGGRAGQAGGAPQGSPGPARGRRADPQACLSRDPGSCSWMGPGPDVRRQLGSVLVGGSPESGVLLGGLREGACTLGGMLDPGAGLPAASRHLLCLCPAQGGPEPQEGEREGEPRVRTQTQPRPARSPDTGISLWQGRGCKEACLPHLTSPRRWLEASSLFPPIWGRMCAFFLIPQNQGFSQGSRAQCWPRASTYQPAHAPCALH